MIFNERNATYCICMVCVLVTASLFVNKMKLKKEDIQCVFDALKGINDYLPNQSKVSLKTDETRPEITYWVRYIMYPTYVDTGVHREFDLILLSAHCSDSIRKKYLTVNTKVFWSNQTNEYKCYLVKNQQ